MATFPSFPVDRRAEVPARPGVYFFFGARDRLLYVGKSKNLQKRVASYFRPISGTGERTRAARASGALHGLQKLHAIQTRARVVYVCYTPTGIEAELLEDYLIKQLQPPLNHTVKPDRKNFLKVTLHEPFPRLEHTKNLAPDGSVYVGPVGGFHRFEPTLRAIRRVFRIRDCEGPVPAVGAEAAHGGCLRCADPKVARVACHAPCHAHTEGDRARVEREYAEAVRDLVAFLGGSDTGIFDELESRMRALAAELAFEEAARVKRRIALLRRYHAAPRLEVSSAAHLDALHRFGDQLIDALHLERDPRLY